MIIIIHVMAKSDLPNRKRIFIIFTFHFVEYANLSLLKCDCVDFRVLLHALQGNYKALHYFSQI